jgi:hypothetical protein
MMINGIEKKYRIGLTIAFRKARTMTAAIPAGSVWTSIPGMIEVARKTATAVTEKRIRSPRMP